MTQLVEYAGKAKRTLPGGWLGDMALPEDSMLIAARGKGSHIFDVDGREFLDLGCGGGALILGHAHPVLTEAVCKQAERGSTFYTLSDRAIELAEKIIDAVPCAELVRFASTGAEATFYALRLARAFTGKSKIIKFEGSFIGSHDYGMVSVTPPLSNRPLSPRLDSGGVPKELADLVIIAPYNDAALACRLIEENKDDLAAVIVEAVQRSIPPHPGFLEGLRETTRRNNVLLVFDEVVTGFRLSHGGAQQYYKVIPDIAAFGKAMAAGYSLSAVAGRADIMQLADPAKKGQSSYVYFSGTLAGNPLSCAVSMATLSVLSQPGVYDRLHEVGQRYREGLAEVLKDSGVPAQVLGVGPMFQVFFTKDPIVNYQDQIRADRSKFDLFCRAMFENGVFMSRRAKNYISVMHDEKDLDLFLNAARKAAKRVHG